MKNESTREIQTVLVTGGAGFIGHHLVKALQKKGCHVRVLDNFSTGSQENLSGEYTLFEGSVCDSSLVGEAVSGCDTVFHLAAEIDLRRSLEDPGPCFQTNIQGTVAVMNAARKTTGCRVLLASSAAVYPLTLDRPATEEDAILGDTPYAISKRVGEQTLELYRNLEKLSACALRCFNVYGPGQNPAGSYAAVIPKFIQSALAGEQIKINGKGDQIRDFVYIDDVVQAYLLAASSTACGSFNIGTGMGTSVQDLAKKVVSMTQSQSEVQFVPEKPGDAPYSLADVRSAKENLHFCSEYSFDEGLKKTISFLKGRT